MQHIALDEISRRARFGPMLLLARRGYAVIISFVSTVTIAHLLTPEQYGLAAMSLVILNFVQGLRDFGLSNALLRKGHIDRQEMDFLFWFNALTTISIVVVISAASPWIAAFYREPIIRDTILVSLVGFLFNGLTFQHEALLKRDLRFDMIAGAEIASLTVGFLTGLIVASIRHDVWAIVYMTLAQSLTMAALTLLASRWMPGRLRMIPNAREIFGFGANSSAFTILNLISRNAGTLIIGRVMGSVSLGIFNRSFALYQLPLNNLLQPIAQAALPVMNRLRPYPDRYAKTYISLVEKLSCVLVFSAAILGAAGVPIVTSLLGGRWAEAGLILAVLSPSLAVYGLFWPTSDLLISQNRSTELRTSGIYDMVLRAGGTLIGAHFGLVGAAAGLSLGTIATAPWRVIQSGREGPVSAMMQYRAFLPSVPLGLCTYLASAVAVAWADAKGFGPVLTSFYAIAAAMLGASVAVATLEAPRRVVCDVVLTLTGRYKA